VDPSRSIERINVAFQTSAMSEENYSVLSIGPVKFAAVDNFSDCVEIGTLVDDKQNIAFSRFFDEGGSPCKSLREVVSSPDQLRGEKIRELAVDYPRFWHGSATLIKPLLIFFDIELIKILVTALLLVSFFLIVLIANRRGIFYSFFIFVFLVLLSDFPFQGMSLTHGISTLAALVSALVIFAVRNQRPWMLVSATVGSGVAYAFFAQLFTPLLFMLIALMLLVFFRDSKVSHSTTRSTTTRIALFWVLGYFLMMSLRFAQVAISSGLTTATSELSSATASKFTFNIVNLFGAVYGHVFIQSDYYDLRILGMIILGLGFGLVMSKPFSLQLLSRSLLDHAVPLTLVMGWYLVMLGHNGHGFVSNLTFGVAIYVLFIFRSSQEGIIEQKIYVSPGSSKPVE
jgi:hypothetical protein